MERSLEFNIAGGGFLPPRMTMAQKTAIEVARLNNFDMAKVRPALDTYDERCSPCWVIWSIPIAPKSSTRTTPSSSPRCATGPGGSSRRRKAGRPVSPKAYQRPGNLCGTLRIICASYAEGTRT